jgi:hypothetical protein
MLPVLPRVALDSQFFCLSLPNSCDQAEDMAQ